MKRATEREDNMIVIGAISIHALVKRATVFTKARYNIDNISIHALVKRATLALKDTSKKYVYFNPRPREEGDIMFQILRVV